MQSKILIAHCFWNLKYYTDDAEALHDSIKSEVI